MPERGGPTTQSGILYQNSVTALYLGRLCDTADRPDAHRVVRVRAEAPAHVDDTVVTYADGRTEYVQAKERVRSGEPAWRELWHAFAAEYRADAFCSGRDRLKLHISEVTRAHEALREVCDRARTARDPAEWRTRLTGEQRNLADSIALLIAPQIPVNDDVLRTFFAHVEVELWPFTSLERDMVPYWMPPTGYRAHTVFRLLRDRVGREARSRGTFEARRLRDELAADDGVLFHTAPDIQELRGAVRATCARLRQHKSTIGETRVHLPRAVATQIAAWALDPGDERRVAMLLDHAGRGKSVVMRDAMTELEARGAMVLALKADQQVSGVDSADALRQRLGLPESVERVASRLAAEGPVVVLVDQLDALSLSLARDQRALDIVLDMVGRVRAVPGVSVLLSCRTFDRNTDPRLKRLEIGQIFPVPVLDDTDVTSVLDTLGIDPGTLSPATRELLRTPLHLDLFASLAAASSRNADRLLGVRSLQGLYDLLWQEVVLRPRAADSSPLARERVLRAATARMHRDQRTSVPRSLLANLCEPDEASAVDELASAGLLIPTETEWTYLHQTFFDYCYARFFVEDGGDLAASVLASDQGLFARPQVVQVLAYMRGNEHPRYLPTLQSLLSARELRFHLRDLVLRWVGALVEPSVAEWRLVYRRLLDRSERAHMMQAMAGHPVWLDHLAAGALEGLLHSDATFADESIVPYLASIAGTDAQEKVAALVRPWLAQDDPSRARAQYVAQRIRDWRAPSAIGLFEDMVGRMPLDQVRHLFVLDDVAEADPSAGCRLLRSIFDRILDAYCAEPAGHPRTLRGVAGHLETLNGSAGQKALTAVSKSAPVAFLDLMVPWLERAVTADSDTALEGNGLYYPSDSVTTSVVDEGNVIRSALLQAYVDSLAALAREDSGAFRNVAQRLAVLPYTTPHLILLRAYRTAGAEYAADALAYVVADARRLRIGENEAYESRMLLRVLSPQLTADQLGALERFVLNETGGVRRWYYGSAGLRWRGVDQMHLLREIPRPRLSAVSRARLHELERKFPNASVVDSATTIRSGVVGPPIPADACARMPDAAWLGAMAKYTHGVRHQGMFRGGSLELSRVLKAHVRAAPARFARLAARVPDSVDNDYAVAFIDGLAESDCPPEWVCDLVRRFATPARPSVHRSAAWALGKIVDRTGQLPGDLLDLLEIWIRGGTRDDEVFYEGQPQDVHHGAINTDRGVALRVLMYALGKQGSDADHARRWAVAEFVAADPSVVLRAGGVDALVYLLEIDRSRAIDLFEETVRGYPRLSTTDPYQSFLFHGSFGQFARLEPYIRDLMHVDASAVRQRGAELATLCVLAAAGLESESAQALAERLAEEAMTGMPDLRRGSARIYAHNWASHPTGQCEAGLLRLFGDADPEVRRQAAWMTRKLKPEHALQRQEFLLAFAGSRAGRSGASDFAEYLWEHGMLDPGWALSVAETLLNSREADDQYTGFSGGEDLVRLVLRIYTDPVADSGLRGRAITLFDQLMDRFSGYALAALAEWDRA